MARDRIATIDTIRGVAVLGILLMNIIGFGFPGAAYLNPSYTGGSDPANIALWALGHVMIDGKMRALFAMLFGASMLLMAESADPHEAAPRHNARMLVLFLFGMVHASLLWPGDILLPFAVVGFLVFPARNLPVNRLFLLAAIALALQAALTLSFGMGILKAEIAASQPGAGADAIAAFEGMRSATYTPPDQVAAEIAAYRGSIGDILAIRHESMVFSRLFLLPFMFMLETTGLMLAGMALYRLGWWQGSHPPTSYRRAAVWLILPGWAIGAVLAWQYHASGFSAAMFFITDAARVLVAPAVAAGYAAVVIILTRENHVPRLCARLAAAGRMALTNYLAASILCNLVFTGVGLGLYGALSRAEALLVVLAIWALQLAWSKPWLARFHQGPFEWLWRSLARREPQPFRRGTPS